MPRASPATAPWAQAPCTPASRSPISTTTTPLVRVDWEFDYQRPKDGLKGTIAFQNIYQLATGEPKVFAYITPDEEQAMKDHGLVEARRGATGSQVRPFPPREKVAEGRMRGLSRHQPHTDAGEGRNPSPTFHPARQ